MSYTFGSIVDVGADHVRFRWAVCKTFERGIIGSGDGEQEEDEGVADYIRSRHGANGGVVRMTWVVDSQRREGGR